MSIISKHGHTGETHRTHKTTHGPATRHTTRANDAGEPGGDKVQVSEDAQEPDDHPVVLPTATARREKADANVAPVDVAPVNPGAVQREKADANVAPVDVAPVDPGAIRREKADANVAPVDVAPVNPGAIRREKADANVSGDDTTAISPEVAKKEKEDGDEGGPFETADTAHTAIDTANSTGVLSSNAEAAAAVKAGRVLPGPVPPDRAAANPSSAEEGAELPGDGVVDKVLGPAGVVLATKQVIDGINDPDQVDGAVKVSAGTLNGIASGAATVAAVLPEGATIAGVALSPIVGVAGGAAATIQGADTTIKGINNGDPTEIAGGALETAGGTMIMAGAMSGQPEVMVVGGVVYLGGMAVQNGKAIAGAAKATAGAIADGAEDAAGGVATGAKGVAHAAEAVWDAL